jgi:hypothetical protein
VSNFYEDGIKMREQVEENAQERYGDTLQLLHGIKRAAEISIDAIMEAEWLRLDRDYWKRQYNESLDRSLKHTQEVTANVLKMALTCDMTNEEKKARAKKRGEASGRVRGKARG